MQLGNLRRRGLHIVALLQVTHAVLKDGTKLEAQLVIAGAGARPNVELFEGQLELLKDKPGGVKVWAGVGAFYIAV